MIIHYHKHCFISLILIYFPLILEGFHINYILSENEEFPAIYFKLELILSGHLLESASVTAFPVNSASFSTHRSEANGVFLARLVVLPCVPVCGTAQTHWQAEESGGVYKKQPTCLPQRIRSEQLIASGKSNTLINRHITKSCFE